MKFLGVYWYGAYQDIPSQVKNKMHLVTPINNKKRTATSEFLSISVLQPIDQVYQSGFFKNTKSVGDIYIVCVCVCLTHTGEEREYTLRFILRNWLIRLWGLASLKSVAQTIGQETQT